MAERLDLLIFGATGFTGMHCIPYVHKLSKSDGRNLTWGVSGRSEEKLKDVLEKMGKRADADLSKIPIVICDINDTDSVFEMAKRAKVVLNCCGPYQFLGEAVVKACIEAGTHHVDVSGEPQYMEKMELLYNEEAKKKGVYVVSACGFDSIPIDLGIIYLQKHFDGVLNSVVTYLETWEEGGTSAGPLVNYGTWQSAVHGLASWNTLKDIRKKLYPSRLPTFKPKLKYRNIPHKPTIVDGWAMPFPGSDRSVVKRTQRYFYENDSQRPIQVDTQFLVKSLLHVVMFGLFGGIFLILTKFSFGRKLLLAYPSFFSAGMFDKKPPSQEKIDKCWVQTTFLGEGWKEKLSDKDDQYTVPPNKAIIGRFKGRNPGYGVTCACLVGAAIMIATEKNKLPNNGKGGVYTPGVAFAKTSLIKLLNENEVTFDIISQKDI